MQILTHLFSLWIIVSLAFEYLIAFVSHSAAMGDNQVNGLSPLFYLAGSNAHCQVIILTNRKSIFNRV